MTTGQKKKRATGQRSKGGMDKETREQTDKSKKKTRDKRQKDSKRINGLMDRGAKRKKKNEKRHRDVRIT